MGKSIKKGNFLSTRAGGSALNPPALSESCNDIGFIDFGSNTSSKSATSAPVIGAARNRKNGIDS